MPNSENRRPKGVWITLVILLVLVALTYAGFWRTRMAADKPEGLTLFEEGRALISPELVDLTGEPFGLAQLKGRWSLLFFGFSNCPEVCPTTLAVMSRAMEQVPEVALERTQLLFVSVDPTRDTPARLREYLAAFHADIGGVTGEAAALAQFRETMGVYAAEEPAEDGNVAHSTALFVVNPLGQLNGVMSAPLTVDGVVGTLNYLAS